MAGASTGLYVFAYSFYYFFFRTEYVCGGAPPRALHLSLAIYRCSLTRLNTVLSHARRMIGFLQTAYFFAYTALGCLALSLITGTLGVATSSLFVRAIYNSISSKLQ